MIQKILSVSLAVIAGLKKKNIYAAISPNFWGEKEHFQRLHSGFYLFIFRFYKSVVYLIFTATT